MHLKIEGNRNIIPMVESLLKSTKKVCKAAPPEQYCFWNLPFLAEDNQDSSNFGELQG